MAILPTVKPSPRPESQVSFTIVTWAIEINLWSAIKDSNVPNVPCTFHVFDCKIIQKMNHWMGNAFHIPGRSGSLCALQYLGRSPRIHWCGPGPLQSLPHARYIPGHDPHRTMVAADPAGCCGSRSIPIPLRPWGSSLCPRHRSFFLQIYIYIYIIQKIYATGLEYLWMPGQKLSSCPLSSQLRYPFSAAMSAALKPQTETDPQRVTAIRDDPPISSLQSPRLPSPHRCFPPDIAQCWPIRLETKMSLSAWPPKIREVTW